MVGPGAKREAVAHLRNVLQMSERRACTVIAADRKMIRYRHAGRPMTSFARVFAISPINAAGSVTGACSFCCGNRAKRQGATASIGSTARKV